MNNKIFLLLNSLVFIACSSTTHQTQTSTSIPKQEPIAIDTQVVNKSSLPDSYKDIQFPEFKYTAPDPLAYRAEISENIISTSACLASPLNKLPDDHPYYQKQTKKYK